MWAAACRGVTLKNRLEYAPTVVLKYNADGTVGQDMNEINHDN